MKKKRKEKKKEGNKTMEEKNMLALEENNTTIIEEDFVGELKSPAGVSYCSFTPKTKEEKILLYNATNSPDHRIGDYINSEITFRYVYVEPVTCVNNETGEQTKCPRVVLISESGQSWTAVSRGIYAAIAKIFVAFGEPSTWEEPMTVKVRQITRGDRKMLTLDVVS